MPASIRDLHNVGNDTPELSSPPIARPVLAARGLSTVGLSDAGRGYCMSRIRPPSGHLLVCHGGCGRVWVEGEWRPCGEGQAYVSPPRVPMAFETVPGQRWRFAWLFFNSTGAALPGSLTGESCTLIDANPQPLTSALEGLYHEAVGVAGRRLLDLWVGLVHEYALRILEPRDAQPFDPLWRVWAEVDQRPAAVWTLERLADLAGTSRESLRKLCQQHVGRSPMQHVTYLRMRRADTLLQSTPAKLGAIAKMVGYDNVFAFSTAFRRCVGAAPSARRRTSSTTPNGPF